LGQERVEKHGHSVRKKRASGCRQAQKGTRSDGVTFKKKEEDRKKKGETGEREIDRRGGGRRVLSKATKGGEEEECGEKPDGDDAVRYTI